MAFLETDVQGSDHICRDLMDDLTAIEDGSDESREFSGTAHRVVIDTEGVTLSPLSAASDSDAATNAADSYHVALKHFREVLEDWEAFILDDQLDDPMDDEDYL